MASTAASFGSTALVKQAVDALVGVYGAADGRPPPHQLMLVATFVAFQCCRCPRCKRSGREPARTSSRRSASRWWPASAWSWLGARPEATMSLFYKAEYVTGAPAPAIPLCAYACFSLSTIIGTITNALGHARDRCLGLVTVIATAGAVNLSIQRAILVGQQPLRAPRSACCLAWPVACF